MKNKNSKPLVSNLSFKIDMTEFKGLVTLLLPRPTRFCNLHTNDMPKSDNVQDKSVSG